MATTVFVDYNNSWVASDITHYAYERHISELLELKWPSRIEGNRTIRSYDIQVRAPSPAYFTVPSLNRLCTGQGERRSSSLGPCGLDQGTLFRAHT